MGFRVYKSFNDAFYSGTTWTTVGSDYLEVSHAICIIGYDDTKNAFLAQNSYGEYGDPIYPGCMWIDYGLITNSTITPEYYVGYPNVWSQLDGGAQDISIGANGSLFITGSDYNYSLGGSSIFTRSGSSWSQITGYAIAVAVAPDGTPWVINSINQIFKRVSNSWVQMPGTARDIAIGGDGSVFVIGTASNGPGYQIYKLVSNYWVQVAGAGIAIAVGPTGVPWVVNSDKNIFQLSGSTWNQMPGTANDIGIGADGTVYIVGTETSDGGFKLYKLVSNDWEQLVAGGGVKITGDSNGKAIAVNYYNNIFQQK